MADRRPDDPSAASSPPTSRPTSRPASKPEADLTERINQAYASSAPIVPDEGADDPKGGRSSKPSEGAGRRPSGADRFAAVLAATSGKMKENAASTRESSTQGGSTAAPPPAKGTSARKPAQSTPGTRPAPRVRKARLRLTHVDPWSVMKTSFLLSIALGIVTVVAVAIVWSVLGAADVWGSIDKSVNDVLGDTTNPFRIEDYLGMSRVMGFTLIVAVADVILVTVIATLGAFLYNLAAALLGGLEVVLAEEDR
ncbi:MAG TPA: DUF3566 domain-containing protein [Marmoricola sp.]|nr:DUF3566 domain-containing protein [Marmoricola sp.]